MSNITKPLRALAIPLVLLTLVGCGDSSGAGQAGPCDIPTPEPTCGQACTFDTDCERGLYCGGDGCTADCTAGTSECGDGFSCSANGECEPDGSGGGSGSGGGGGGDDCPGVLVGLTAETPQVMLVIDQSGSMNEGFGSTDRWNAVEQALVNRTDGVVATLADRVVFGASLYTSNGGDAGGTCPLLQSEPLALDNYDPIAALMARNGPAGDTPTAEAIEAVRTSFPPVDPARPGPRLIVLATDGDPDNCVDPDAHDAGSQQLSEQAVQRAHADGIETYVLSVGADVSADHLQRLANAGIGAPLGGTAGTPIVATNPDQLVAAFDQLVGAARRCSFQLDGDVDLNRADEGTVELNGTPLEYDVDWRLTDRTTLELLGDACDTFLTEADVALSANFPCGVVIL